MMDGVELSEWGQAVQAVRIQSREAAFFLDVAVGRRRGIKISRRPELDRGAGWPRPGMRSLSSRAQADRAVTASLRRARHGPWREWRALSLHEREKLAVKCRRTGERGDTAFQAHGSRQGLGRRAAMGTWDAQRGRPSEVPARPLSSTGTAMSRVLQDKSRLQGPFGHGVCRVCTIRLRVPSCAPPCGNGPALMDQRRNPAQCHQCS